MAPYTAAALVIAAVLLSSVSTSVYADSSGNYYAGFKILGSDGVPVSGAVGIVIVNAACYECGSLPTAPVAAQASDTEGIIGVNLPVGCYIMQIVRPGGGIYLQFDFYIPQNGTMTVTLGEDSSTIEKELAQNPINLGDYGTNSTAGLIGPGSGSVNGSSGVLPNGTSSVPPTPVLTQNTTEHQLTEPIYVLSYASPPVVLFGLALLAIALESTSQVARKKGAKPESSESAR